MARFAFCKDLSTLRAAAERRGACQGRSGRRVGRFGRGPRKICLQPCCSDSDGVTFTERNVRSELPASRSESEQPWSAQLPQPISRSPVVLSRPIVPHHRVRRRRWFDWGLEVTSTSTSRARACAGSSRWWPIQMPLADRFFWPQAGPWWRLPRSSLAFIPLLKLAALRRRATPVSQPFRPSQAVHLP